MRGRRISIVSVWCIVVGLGCSAGCFRPICSNKPLLEYDPGCGYRFDCLTFSGGGTRAAAVAYGVLQALHNTPLVDVVPNDDDAASRTSPGSRTLLDEIDVISSVSGGSFTAMTYALERQAIFQGSFERKFLKQDVERKIVSLLLNFRNLVFIPWVVLDRMDVTAKYFAEELFENATYQKLIERGERPFVVVNATNMALEQQFQFTQDEFDVLGSDLAQLPVGYAVGASSAFPLVFSPLRLQYFPEPAGAEVLDQVLTDTNGAVSDRRRVRWARSLCDETNADDCELDQANHKYLYLLDGGISDNLGLNWVVNELRHGVLSRKLKEGKIKRLVVIIVDAGTEQPENLESQNAAPGLFLMAAKSASTPIDNLSAARTEELRYLLRDLPKQLRAIDARNRARIADTCPQVGALEVHHALAVEPYLIDLNFHAIRDEEQRRRLLHMPTRLFLSNAAVDELMDVGGRLLTQHEDFQRLRNDLGATRP